MTLKSTSRLRTILASAFAASLLLAASAVDVAAQLVYPPLEPAPAAAPPASAAPRSRAAKTQAVAARREKGGYFLDFRSRYALSYGHTFVVFGRLGANGRPATSEVAGLHPAGDDVAPWSIGHIIPVPSETGASDGDTEDQYITASYRIHLTAAQYQDVVAYIRKLQGSSPVWHAVLYNCNAFVADIARHMGLKSPGTLSFPADFINGIRSMNGNVSRVSLPAVDASIGLSTPR